MPDGNGAMRSLLTLMICLVAAGGVRAGDDPFIGQWAMDVAGSHYGSGELPRKMVIAMQETPEGISYRSTSTQRDGRTTTAEYVADYLGHLALVVGDSGMMSPVSVKRIDARTVEATYMRGFKVMAVSRRVVSPDGLVMTITTTSRSECRQRRALCETAGCQGGGLTLHASPDALPDAFIRYGLFCGAQHA
jgi:hypothetical protein